MPLSTSTTNPVSDAQQQIAVLEQHKATLENSILSMYNQEAARNPALKKSPNIQHTLPILGAYKTTQQLQSAFGGTAIALEGLLDQRQKLELAITDAAKQLGHMQSLVSSLSSSPVKVRDLSPGGLPRGVAKNIVAGLGQDAAFTAELAKLVSLTQSNYTGRSFPQPYSANPMSLLRAATRANVPKTLRSTIASNPQVAQQLAQTVAVAEALMQNYMAQNDPGINKISLALGTQAAKASMTAASQHTRVLQQHFSNMALPGAQYRRAENLRASSFSTQTMGAATSQQSGGSGRTSQNRRTYNPGSRTGGVGYGGAFGASGYFGGSQGGSAALSGGMAPLAMNMLGTFIHHSVRSVLGGMPGSDIIANALLESLGGFGGAGAVIGALGAGAFAGNAMTAAGMTNNAAVTATLPSISNAYLNAATQKSGAPLNLESYSQYAKQITALGDTYLKSVSDVQPAVTAAAMAGATGMPNNYPDALRVANSAMALSTLSGVSPQQTGQLLGELSAKGGITGGNTATVVSLLAEEAQKANIPLALMVNNLIEFQRATGGVIQNLKGVAGFAQVQGQLGATYSPSMTASLANVRGVQALADASMLGVSPQDFLNGQNNPAYLMGTVQNWAKKMFPHGNTDSGSFLQLESLLGQIMPDINNMSSSQEKKFIDSLYNPAIDYSTMTAQSAAMVSQAAANNGSVMGAAVSTAHTGSSLPATLTTLVKNAIYQLSAGLSDLFNNPGGHTIGSIAVTKALNSIQPLTSSSLASDIARHPTGTFYSPSGGAPISLSSLSSLSEYMKVLDSPANPLRKLGITPDYLLSHELASNGGKMPNAATAKQDYSTLVAQYVETFANNLNPNNHFNTSKISSTELATAAAQVTQYLGTHSAAQIAGFNTQTLNHLQGVTATKYAETLDVQLSGQLVVTDVNGHLVGHAVVAGAKKVPRPPSKHAVNSQNHLPTPTPTHGTR